MAQSNAFSVTVQAGGGGVPAYISSMSAYQVRNLSGTYAPTNGTSSLVSVMPGIWSGNTDIMRPWSGGAKSITGTKMYVHGGGHSDSSNNGLYSFDFAGTNAPTGWAVENQGQTGVTSDPSIGSNGAPVSVHTYDGMCDMGDFLFRVGGSTYPNGFFTETAMRFTKSTKVWTRLPNWPGQSLGGAVVGNTSDGKVLAMDRWVEYLTYAFYRVSTNNWSSLKSVSNQWPDDFSAAYSPTLNVGIAMGSGSSFSYTIDWTSETIVQTSRSLPSLGSGPSLFWDASRNVFWAFGGSSNNSTIYEINPSNWSSTAHTLTGNAPLSPESGTRGSYGRFVYLPDWRAIGAVANRNNAAFVIKLP